MKTPSYFKPNVDTAAMYQAPVVVVPAGVTREASDAKGSRSVPNFALSKAIERFQARKEGDMDIAVVCGEEVLDLLTRDTPNVPVQIVSPVIVRKNEKLLDQNVYSLPALGAYLVASHFKSTLGLGPYEVPFELVANVEVFQLCRQVRGEPVASQADIEAYVSRCQRASQRLQGYQAAQREVGRPVRFLGLSARALQQMVSALGAVSMLYAAFYKPRPSRDACPPELIKRSPHAACIDGAAMQRFNKDRNTIVITLGAVLGSMALGLVAAHVRAFTRARSQVGSAQKLLESEEFRDVDA